MLATLLASENVQTSLHLCPPERLSEILASELRRGPDVLIAVGGDGTTSSVASVCARVQIPLGIVPGGTRNHFARDLNLPNETEGAVRCIAQGNLARLDLGEVNGHLFINNSSIGAYPRALVERQALIDRFGLRKSAAQVLATLRVFARRPLVRAEIEIDGIREPCATPFVFVGNNRYQVRPLGDRFREVLDGGQLCVFTAGRTGLGFFFRLFWLSLRNRLDRASGFQMTLGESALIRLPRPFVRVAKDGEILRLETPLRFVIRKKALNVIVPPCAA